MIDIRDLSVVVAAASVVVAVVNFVRSNKIAQEARKRELETRQAQLFMQIYDCFHRPDFMDRYTDIVTWRWSDYDDFMKRYGIHNLKAFYSLGSVAAFFEGIGVLVQRKLIDANIVADLMARHIIMFWEKFRPISEEMRKKLQIPEIDIWLEYLYNEVKLVTERQRQERLLKKRAQ